MSPRKVPLAGWAFARRFRRGGFGWKSSVAVPAVRAAVAEIRKAARRDAVLSAEGAVKFLERIVPALENVDSSSGAMGTAVNAAIAELAPIVGNAPLDGPSRARILERLWIARQDDQMGYLDLLEDYWGEYCGSQDAASAWADEHVEIIRYVSQSGYISGSVAVLSALFAAGRYEEILARVETTGTSSWTYRSWAFRALATLGRAAEALRYAEASRGVNDHGIDAACERLLLDAGMEEEAYRRYAMAAVRYHATNLATFRAMRKKYPRVEPAALLLDLAKRDPGREGRWFAAAVSAELYDLALQFARASSSDPKTLTRAAREHATRDPAFSLAIAELALVGIARGYGYEITALDAIAAYTIGREAARELGSESEYHTRCRVIAGTDAFLARALRL